MGRINKQNTKGDYSMTKIRIDSNFHSPSGYGSVVRSFTENLNKDNTLDLSLRNLEEPNDKKIKWQHDVSQKIDNSIGKPDHILMWSDVTYRSFYIKEPIKYATWPDVPNYHYFVWELNKIPEIYISLLEDIRTDKIFTASDYSKKIIQKSVNIPVEIVPHGYNPNIFKKLKNIKKRKKFVALFVGTWTKRKAPLENVLATIEALQNTDSEIWLKLHHDEVSIKAIRRSIQTSVVRQFKDRNVKLPKIFILNKYMSQKEMNNMYNKADIVFSVSRGEAFNMPLLESIATQTPIITTNIGGQMDFIDNKYKYLVEVDRDIIASGETGFYKEEFGLRWHDVNYKLQTEKTQDLYNLWNEDRDEFDSIGQSLYQNAKGLTWDYATATYLNYVK